MYSIYSDGVCIYNDVNTAPEIKMIDPTLTLADNTAGTLKFKLPQSNVGYDNVNRVSSIIKVYKEGKEIWEGRAISEEIDFWNNRSVTCEGELGYLNDTIQFPPEDDPDDPYIDQYGGAYYNVTPLAFLEHILAIHNGKVEDSKKFKVGTVTVTDRMINEMSGDDKDDEDADIYVYTDYISTLDAIKTKLIDQLGGHLVIRKVDGERYLDYLADYLDEGSQMIEFRKNLLDFTRSFDESQFATVIIPLGKQLDITANDGGTEYPTIEDVNDGKNYLKNDDAVEAFGWIERIVNFDDIGDEEELLAKGQEYLTDLQFADLTLKLNAYDLHYLDNTIDEIKLLHQVRVISRPHGLNRVFPITELTLNLANPSGCIFTLGEEKINSSLSSYTNQVAGSVSKEFSEGWSVEHKVDSTLLGNAKKTARNLINNATRGYITISRDQEGTDAFYIANEDERNINNATKYWKWTLGGLGYFNLEESEDPTIAITGPDGGIVANSVTTGTMLADRVRAGILQSNNANVVWNLDTGDLKMNQGSIRINGANAVDSIDEFNPNLLYEEGELVKKDGLIYKRNANDYVTITGGASAYIFDQNDPNRHFDRIVTGSTVFSVDPFGNLKANSVEVEGDIKATNLNATGTGKIGPLNINNDRLSFGSTFSIDGTGSARFEGDIYCKSIHAEDDSSGRIDGQYVILDNLDADRITAGTISADHIDAESIVAGDIEGVNITACNLEGCTITGGSVISDSGGVYCDLSYGTLSFYTDTDWVASINTMGVADVPDTIMSTAGKLWLESYTGVYSDSIWRDNPPNSKIANMRITPTAHLICSIESPVSPSSSARRFKNSIDYLIEPELDPHKLYELPVVQFKYNTDFIKDKDDDRYDRLLPGFIAEDVEELYPAATYHEDNKIYGWVGDMLIPPMMYLIQEQHHDIENLKNEIERLKNG